MYLGLQGLCIDCSHSIVTETDKYTSSSNGHRHGTGKSQRLEVSPGLFTGCLVNRKKMVFRKEEDGLIGLGKGPHIRITRKQRMLFLAEHGDT